MAEAAERDDGKSASSHNLFGPARLFASHIRTNSLFLFDIFDFLDVPHELCNAHRDVRDRRSGHRAKGLFLMHFFGKIAALGLIVGSLAACGGADSTSEPAPAPPENIEQNEGAETASSPTTPTETTPETPESPTAVAEVAEESPFADLPAPYNTADYARGRRTFKLCVSCHLVEEGAGHRVGPNLHGFFGREAGTADGFAYSDALTEADFVWTPEELEQWLANPRTYLPGNRMSFSGVRRPDDRTAVIAYLMVETAAGASTND